MKTRIITFNSILILPLLLITGVLFAGGIQGSNTAINSQSGKQYLNDSSETPHNRPAFNSRDKINKTGHYKFRATHPDLYKKRMKPSGLLSRDHISRTARNTGQNRSINPLSNKNQMSCRPVVLLAKNGVNKSAAGNIDEAWVRHYESRLMPSDDRVCAAAVDTLGNVYVTGQSTDSFDAIDFVTIKYDASGTEIWNVRYDTGYDDIPAAIAVDESGDVLVAGYSYNPGTGFDFITVKYNPSGIEQWVARYSGIGNSEDAAMAMTLDGSGNVLVTGYSYSAGSSYDYVTVKYNPSGTEQWIARYNGAGNSSDFPTAIVVSGSGDVFVTGCSYDTITYHFDYATIKYNSFGNEQWVKRFNGPANADDYAIGLAIDTSDNVYVTGTCYDNNNLADYATVRYSSSGSEQWVRYYNGPGNYQDEPTAIAVDLTGSIFVTGNSAGVGTSINYATIKYDPSGTEQWIARYNGTGNSDDRASGIAIDTSGSIYVTGSSYKPSSSSDYATVKYNSSGIEQWAVRYNGPDNLDDGAEAIAVDRSGNVFVTGYSYDTTAYSDFATVKYNSSGSEQWRAFYTGPGNSSDYAITIAADKSDNIYVMGVSYSSGTYSDFLTIKYNSSGDEQWTARFNGPANFDDTPAAMTVDTSGNVYVTGYSVGSSNYNDYATVKYNSSGIEQWVAWYNGPGDDDDKATDLAIDGSGNVYVTGSSIGSHSGFDYATVKYNSSGAEQWIARYTRPGYNDDMAVAVCVDASGYVYVTGSTRDSSSMLDYSTVKYNSSGTEQWVARYDGTRNSDDVPTAMTIDTSGNVYITGCSSGLNLYFDYATIKYNSSGNEQWAARYNGPANYDDYASGIAVDKSGNVYITGYSSNLNYSTDYVTIKYNPSGSEQWAARYNGPGDDYDVASSIAIDNSGYTYVTGYSVGSGTSQDFTTIRYSPSGVEDWVARYNYSGYCDDEAKAVIVDASGNVFVTGCSSGSYSTIFTTIKYTPPPVSVEEKTFLTIGFSLDQNYPNPFNPSTMIKYTVPAGTRHIVSLRIFDLLGREIATLVNENKPAGAYQVEWNAAELPSGVYFYRLQIGSFNETKKLLLLK